MQKRIFGLSLLIGILGVAFGAHAQYGKTEVGLAYGYYSYFTLKQGQPFSNSTGTPNVNVRHYFSPVVTFGLGLGFENIRNWGSLFTISPEATFRYLDTKDNRIRVRLYGAVAYGLSVFDDWNTNPNHADNTGPKLWGFQLTPIGIRIGRKYSCFAEVGLGYKGLINGGMSYRFRTARHTDLKEH